MLDHLTDDNKLDIFWSEGTTQGLADYSEDIGRIYDVSDKNYWLYVIDKSEGSPVLQSKGAHAEGYSTLAVGYGAHAEGYANKSIGNFSHTEGRNNVAHYAAHAEGRGTEASGEMSHAEGRSTKALREFSHAEGKETEAHYIAHAEGHKTKALAQASHAEGENTIASGIAAHAEGENSQASGDYSHAEGEYCAASGIKSHAEGKSSIASGYASHAEGENTKAIGYASHAEGKGTQAIGVNSHSGGINTIASGDNSFAIGSNTKAYSHRSAAFGDGAETGIAYTIVDELPETATLDALVYLTADGKTYKFTSNGWKTNADDKNIPADVRSSGLNAFAAGRNTKAVGNYTFAVGENSYTAGTATFASGKHSKVSAGEAGHACGFGVLVTRSDQFACGKFNNPSSNNINTAGYNSEFMVGYGTSDTDRKNLFEVNRSGFAMLPQMNNDLIANRPNAIATVGFINSKIDQDYNSESENAQSGKAVKEAIGDKLTVFWGEELKRSMITEPNKNSIKKEVYNTEPDSVFWKANLGDIYVNPNQNIAFICTKQFRLTRPNTDVTWNETHWSILERPDVDQTYASKSEHAQSGLAVAEAISTKMDKFGEVTLLDEDTYEIISTPQFRLKSSYDNWGISSMGNDLTLSAHQGRIYLSS